jgi:hypothetical protein
MQGVRLVEADVIAVENRYRHDPIKLAATIMRWPGHLLRLRRPMRPRSPVREHE